VPSAAGLTGELGSAVFVRRSSRPSRRAVLHLHDLTDSFAPTDLARWYNERAFHFYVADLDPRQSLEPPSRRRPARSRQSCFAELDSACAYLREAEGIDAIILSAHGPAGPIAAQWCAARRDQRPVGALILSAPKFGRGLPGSLDIDCPVLVICPAGGNAPGRRGRRSSAAIRLGQHVTWLHLADAAEGDSPADRKRLFDEMGRWLGAYMYGQLRDQLL